MAREILKADVGMFPKKFNPKISRQFAGGIGNAFQQAIVEIPLLPRYGNPGDVLIKTSSNDYDVEWGVSGATTNVNNGLELNTATVQLGGDLIKDTLIDGQNFKFFLQNLSELFLNSQITSLEGIIALDILSDKLTLIGESELNIRTPNVVNSLAEKGQILSLTDAITGKSEFVERFEFASIQEVCNSDDLVVQPGESLWVATPKMSGVVLTEISAVVATSGADNSSLDVVVGGITHSLTITGGSSSTTLGGLNQTINSLDTGIINVTALGASVPKGLTVTLTFKYV